ncbi:MAG: helix-turn-helix domain-containing protein [Pseudomonadota bacterium]
MARTQAYNRVEALESAMALFWRKGYHATSMKDLEGALRMRPGSIYAAFKSKENLFTEALDLYFERGQQSLSNQIDQEKDGIAALEAHLRSFVPDGAVPDHPQACMIVKAILETSVPSPTLADHARILFNKARKGFQQVFEMAQAKGDIAESHDPVQLARKYQADITTLRLGNHIAAGSENNKELADIFIQNLNALRKS